MKIRQAKLADLEEIAAIELENFSSEEAMDATAFKKHIEELTSTFLVAEKDGQILGYLEGPVTLKRQVDDQSFTDQMVDEASKDGGFITITSLSIAKFAQGMGGGEKLLEAMKKLAMKEEREGISLTCHDYLLAYYEKHGFVNEGLSASTYAGEVWYDMVWENPLAR